MGAIPSLLITVRPCYGVAQYSLNKCEVGQIRLSFERRQSASDARELVLKPTGVWGRGCIDKFGDSGQGAGA